MIKFLLKYNFKCNNPISSVQYYTKTIGDNCYDVYLYPHKIKCYIYDKDDIESIRNFYFTIDCINFLKAEIRKAKINKMLCLQ